MKELLTEIKNAKLGDTFRLTVPALYRNNTILIEKTLIVTKTGVNKFCAVIEETHIDPIKEGLKLLEND